MRLYSGTFFSMLVLRIIPRQLHLYMNFSYIIITFISRYYIITSVLKLQRSINRVKPEHQFWPTNAALVQNQLIVSVCRSSESLLKSFNHPVFRACNCDGNCFWLYQKEMEKCCGRASRHAARIRIELTLEVIYYLFFLFLLIARTS